jgi:glycosyltransferase involved in cell wall biosynthesis
MKILLVSIYDGFEGGGAVLACKRLHLALLKQGYNCRLLLLEKQENITQSFSFFNLSSTISRIKKRIKKYTQYYLYSRQYNKNPKNHYLHSPASSVYDITQHELYKWADVVNLHYVSNFIDYPSFFSKKQTKPIVWTLHDMNAFTGGCHHAEVCIGFEKECTNCPQLSATRQNYNHINWVIKSKGNYNRLTLISPSNWLKDKSQSSSLFKQLPHYTLPNSVDTHIFKVLDKAFCKTFFNIPVDNKTLLFVAREVALHLKGMSILLETLPLIKSEIKILVIGKINFQQFQHERVTILGSISDERMLALAYNAADVLVMPSLEENLPNVIIESLCCGTPVIAFKTGGIPELIQNDENGFLAEKGSAQSLAENIEKSLNFSWNRNNISQLAQEKFATEVQVRNYVNLFNEILE